MTLFLTWFLSVILIGVPTSTWRPTSPGHPTTFSKALPSILKVRWYPTCILEFPFRNRRTNNTNDSTLSRFPGLFKDDIPPIIVFIIPKYYMDNPKFLRTFEVFLNCYTKISDFFHLSSTLCNFFLFFFEKRKTIQRFTTPVNLFLKCLTKVSKLIWIVKLFFNFFLLVMSDYLRLFRLLSR